MCARHRRRRGYPSSPSASGARGRTHESPRRNELDRVGIVSTGASCWSAAEQSKLPPSAFIRWGIRSQEVTLRSNHGSERHGRQADHCKAVRAACCSSSGRPRRSGPIDPFAEEAGRGGRASETWATCRSASEASDRQAPGSTGGNLRQRARTAASRVLRCPRNRANRGLRASIQPVPQVERNTDRSLGGAVQR